MIPLFDYKYELIMESQFEFRGCDFLFFNEGVPFYSLYRGTRKLNSFWEVRYVAEVLYYLNPNISENLFISLMTHLSSRESGHVIRTYSSERIIDMCDAVLTQRKTPYVRRYRRIVFNAGKAITSDEKLSIVGQVIGSLKKKRRYASEKLYDAVEVLINKNKKITYQKIGELLGCTRQTVSVNMTDAIKEIISFHNRQLALSPSVSVRS